METRRTEVTPHPYLVETLFAYKSRVSAIFNDILGIHKINYFSVARVDERQNILIFSSTPAIEFNLFTTSLWRFDNTYNPDWFMQCTHATSTSLYQAERYKDLYFTKQLKPELPAVCSLAVKKDCHYIYSLGSTCTSLSSKDWFMSHENDFSKMGEYCTMQLTPLFQRIANNN